MTLTEKRIKFAEWMGWKYLPSSQDGEFEPNYKWLNPVTNQFQDTFTKYDKDLNAMAEVENKLEVGFDGSEQDDYQQQLYEIVNPGRSFINDFSKGRLPDVAYLQNFICATAHQRFEAVGRAVGLWDAKTGEKA